MGNKSTNNSSKLNYNALVNMIKVYRYTEENTPRSLNELMECIDVEYYLYSKLKYRKNPLKFIDKSAYILALILELLLRKEIQFNSNTYNYYQEIHNWIIRNINAILK